MKDAIRYCKICEALLVRNDGERAHKFALRQTCGAECARVLARRTHSGGKPPLIDPPCIICEVKPRLRDNARRLYLHCGSDECREGVYQRRQMLRHVGWPLVQPTEWPEGCFLPHNIEPGDGGIGKLALPVPDRTLGGVQRWAFQ